MAATEQEIDELSAKIVEVQNEHNENEDKLPRSKLRELSTAVTAMQAHRSMLIAEGCLPCRKCGSPPTGKIQMLAVGDEPIAGYGIDCSRPACRARARHLTLDKMRERWNTRPERLDAPDSHGAELSVQRNIA